MAISPVISQNVDELEQKRQEIENKLKEVLSQKDTLSNQIKYLNSQYELAQLKIKQTESSIVVLEQEVTNLTVKIDNLDVYLNRLSGIFIEQVIQNYKLQKKAPPLAFFFLNNFNDGLQQYKYISTTQKNSQETLINMETVRTNYDIQKTDKEKKQLELQNMQERLDQEKKSLATQKEAKDALLEITKNDEKKYQKLKQDIENEIASLLSAKYVGKKDVKKGDVLGTMGNTGYSFGDHLHFGLYDLSESNLSSWRYTNDTDPFAYLSQNSWPMSNYTITQSRGVTKYSYLYADRFHHGVDMVSSNKAIKAVNDGVAYFFRNPGSSLGNHVKLFHSDGKMTLYLHMQ